MYPTQLPAGLKPAGRGHILVEKALQTEGREDSADETPLGTLSIDVREKTSRPQVDLDASVDGAPEPARVESMHGASDVSSSEVHLDTSAVDHTEKPLPSPGSLTETASQASDSDVETVRGDGDVAYDDDVTDAPGTETSVISGLADLSTESAATNESGSSSGSGSTITPVSYSRPSSRTADKKSHSPSQRRAAAHRARQQVDPLSFLDADSPAVTPESIRRSVEEASTRWASRSGGGGSGGPRQLAEYHGDIGLGTISSGRTRDEDSPTARSTGSASSGSGSTSSSYRSDESVSTTSTRGTRDSSRSTSPETAGSVREFMKPLPLAQTPPPPAPQATSTRAGSASHHPQRTSHHQHHRSYGTPEMPRGTAQYPHVPAPLLLGTLSGGVGAGIGMGGAAGGVRPAKHLPRAEKLPLTGYELLASRLSSACPSPSSPGWYGAGNRQRSRSGSGSTTSSGPGSSSAAATTTTATTGGSTPPRPPPPPQYQVPSPPFATTTVLKPIYRRFESLNHRLLLHLQDELAELEEQLHRLDTADTQTRRSVGGGSGSGPAATGGIMPASRRAEFLGGGELQWHRTDILGKIGYKLGQYSKYIVSTLHPAKPV